MSDIVDFQLRHGTQDKQVFDEVIVKNQYHLPDKFPADSLIIDIGANVGAFAVACLLRGAGTVVCFEPDPINCQQLEKNTAAWKDKVSIFKAAVRRSDAYEKCLYIGHEKNTACGGVITEGEPFNKAKGHREPIEVQAIGLDELLFHVSDGGKRKVDLMKIDAEGSEYKIIYTSRHLDICNKIVGETHQYTSAWPNEEYEIFGVPGKLANSEAMKDFLEKQGFAVTLERETYVNATNTLFFAERK